MTHGWLYFWDIVVVYVGWSDWFGKLGLLSYGRWCKLSFGFFFKQRPLGGGSRINCPLWMIRGVCSLYAVCLLKVRSTLFPFTTFHTHHIFYLLWLCLLERLYTLARSHTLDLNMALSLLNEVYCIRRHLFMYWICTADLNCSNKGYCMWRRS
jgi:hypothetical protein